MTEITVTWMIVWKICYFPRDLVPLHFWLCFQKSRSQLASRLTTTYCFSIQIEVGLVVGNSQVAFEKAENSSLNLIGKIYSFQKIQNEVGSIAVTMCDSAYSDF